MAGFLIGVLIIVVAAVRLAASQSSGGGACWRDTPCSNITEAAFSGEWDANIYAPTSRTVVPASILSVNGTVLRAYGAGSSELAGNGSILVFDFGKEVGGIVSLDFRASASSNSSGNSSGNSSSEGAVGLAFSEGKNWIGEWSDSSNGGQNDRDGAVYANFTQAGAVNYTLPDAKLRGGFRYLSLFLVASAASVQLDRVQVEIAFQPTWSNLRAYQGYFHSNDALLNQIWYSCAYTLQTCAIPPNTGRSWPPPSGSVGWSNTGELGSGYDMLVDGAKRDRAVWPGDLGVAVPAAFVTIGDLTSTRNALQTIYDHQNSDGSFPQAGPPLLIQGSDAYHMWTMIGTYNYMLYQNDTAFLSQNWAGYTRAAAYIWAKVTSTRGLLDVTGAGDWARLNSAGEISEAQMLLYRALQTGRVLAGWAGDTTGLAAVWAARAAALQTATLTYLYDTSHGAFQDSVSDATTHPQDGNALAVLMGVVAANSTEAQNISARLTDNWSIIGAVAPELPNNISPFISSLEVLAHLAAGRPDRAVALVRASWGWYLQHPNGTQSTAIEGYLADGTFGYRASSGYSDYSYPSHSHGWSTGPATALTEGVLGLQVTDRQGSAWTFAPQLAPGLSDVQGGFVTGLGPFQARWWRQSDSATAYNATLRTPAGTTGQLVLPVAQNGTMPTVQIDGAQASPRWYRQDVDGVTDLVAVDGVAGGNHTISVQ